MSTESVTQSPGRVFAQRVYEIRERRGLRQKDLADRLTAIGRPTHRMTVAKIEDARNPDAKPGNVTRAENVSVGELLAFALALNVSPVHLIVPREDDATVAVTPKAAAGAAFVREWIRGRRPLWTRDVPGSARALFEWLTEIPKNELAERITEGRTSGLDPLEQMVVEQAVRGEARELVEHLMEPDAVRALLEEASYIDEVKGEQDG